MECFGDRPVVAIVYPWRMLYATGGDALNCSRPGDKMSDDKF